MTVKVADRSPIMAALVARMQKGRALAAGSDGMRKAGKKYLPKFEKESDANYDARLSASWLFNGYAKTIKDMTGKVFLKPLTFGEDMPEVLQADCEDVDLQGQHINMFARNLLEDAFHSGIAWIMVDAPKRDAPVTQTQADALYLRPYMVHLRAEEVLGWQTQAIGGKTVISQIRIMEKVAQADPKDEFAETMVDQVRVIDRREGFLEVRLFQKATTATEWQVVDTYTVQVPEITVFPFYVNRTGFWQALPPLEDLADINIAHWQSQSDQRNILHVARVPILFGAGMTEDPAKPITISSQQALLMADPAAKLMFVEASGGAIAHGRQDLKDLEFQMETFGLQLLVQKMAGQSATGEAIDNTKETSQLGMIADSLQDALENALQAMALYRGLPEGGSLVVNKDFGGGRMSAQEMQLLLTAVNTHQISQVTFLKEMVARGFLSGDVDPQEEADLAAEESMNDLALQAEAFGADAGGGPGSPPSGGKGVARNRAPPGN